MSAEQPCVFCAIVRREEPAHVVYEDPLTVAFLDRRQFHEGHTLVVPRAHVPDIRALTDVRLGSALMLTAARVARAVDAACPGGGISVWLSAGDSAGQEVPHLHIHIHPRRPGDGLLRVYPSAPAEPGCTELAALAHKIRAGLNERANESDSR